MLVLITFIRRMRSFAILIPLRCASRYFFLGFCRRRKRWRVCPPVPITFSEVCSVYKLTSSLSQIGTTLWMFIFFFPTFVPNFFSQQFYSKPFNHRLAIHFRFPIRKRIIFVPCVARRRRKNFIFHTSTKWFFFFSSFVLSRSHSLSFSCVAFFNVLFVLLFFYWIIFIDAEEERRSRTF